MTEPELEKNKKAKPSSMGMFPSNGNNDLGGAADRLSPEESPSI